MTVGNDSMFMECWGEANFARILLHLLAAHEHTSVRAPNYLELLLGSLALLEHRAMMVILVLELSCFFRLLWEPAHDYGKKEK